MVREGLGKEGGRMGQGGAWRGKIKVRLYCIKIHIIDFFKKIYIKFLI